MKNRIQEMETTHPLVAFRKGMVQRRRRPLHQDPYGLPEQRNHTVGKRKVRNESPFYLNEAPSTRQTLATGRDATRKDVIGYDLVCDFTA